MDLPEFDTDAVFDDDYLYFMQERLRDEVSDREAVTLSTMAGLHQGTTVLDLACGHGRLANGLAARGCEVTGLDANEYFLDLARRDAEARGVQVDYVLGDMRDLPWDERFEVAINWFTAFGYFDDEGNRQVLAAVHQGLRPAGRFLLELPNHSRVMREFRDSSVVDRDGDLMIERRRHDPLTGTIPTERIVLRGGRVRRVRFFVRLFSFTELRDWLLAAGFSSVEGYDGGGGPLTADSRRMIVMAHR